MQIGQHSPDPKSQSKLIPKASQISSNSTNSQLSQKSQIPSNSTDSQLSQKSHIPSKPTESPALREVVVGTRTGMSMVVPLKVDDSDAEAVVDSGA